MTTHAQISCINVLDVVIGGVEDLQVLQELTNAWLLRRIGPQCCQITIADIQFFQIWSWSEEFGGERLERIGIEIELKYLFVNQSYVFSITCFTLIKSWLFQKTCGSNVANKLLLKSSSINRINGLKIDKRYK